ncbi:hypothetical protein FOA24_09720 [Bacillus thuringiensis]|uniref:hypothetical protein n=1 Tax=Bacillus thuringiensis TaxID=1428 RepID=UPI00333896F2
MNKLETLIAQYPEITFNFSNEMPNGLSGLCFDNEIYINNTLNQTTAEKYVTVSEEIAHYEKGVGNIIRQETITDRQQEFRARKIGCLRIVTINDILLCYEKGIQTPWDIADELEVTTSCVTDAFEYIRTTKGISFYHKNYLVHFLTDTHINIQKF